MQQLTIEHKNIIENRKKDRREGKGRVLAISRNVFRLQNKSSHIYYVESESRDDHYYFVKFKQDVFQWCSCKDNSTRHTIKCKHLFAIEFAIKWGTIKDIDKLPTTADTDQNTSNDIQTTAVTTKPAEVVVTARRTKSYVEDDYDF